MSEHDSQELQPFTSEDIENLRAELRPLNLKGTPNTLDEDSIEKLLLLPPSLLSEAVRRLVVAFGPLSSFPVPEHPFSTTIPRDKTRPKIPNPIIDDGASFLEGALTALTSYNTLLEEKVAKFSVQSTRSLAALRESSTSDYDVVALDKRTAAVKLRNSLHAQQIASLRNSIDSHEKKRFQKLEEYSKDFQKEVLSLNCFDTFFTQTSKLVPETASSSKDVWDEYDYVLQHIERWRGLVTVDLPESEATINHARRHVNQLVYLITHNCHVQLATVFHESLADNIGVTDHQKVVQDEAADIIKEIDWLWEEVIPVAHMSVSAQFLRPALQQFKKWEDSKYFREAVVSTYASGVLKFMNDRLSAVAERTQVLVYHHQALHNVARVRQLEEASNPADMTSGRIPQTLAQSTQLKRESTAVSENLRVFMQIYGGVSIDTNDPFPNPTPSRLEVHVKSRAHKGDILLQDLHKLFETATKSGLTDRELGGELLLDSLLADSAASPNQLGSVYKDAQLEGSIAMLREQASQIQEIFKDLKLEGPTSAPDYVAHAYRQIDGRLAAKAGDGCFRGGENPKPTCNACIRCLKFEDFVRKWGH
ncbi:hypothetical protein F4825DRAFT_199094 [Nemania diffusa]|nr:hypothetical protein F4825DRAFT_199094 [Nemania diffusa]